MAKNMVEYHIQEGAFHTLKVASGANVKIGQLVTIAGDKTVNVAGDGDKALGIVYSGTVGIDGVGVGYSGDNGDVATVIVLKPFVYLEAGGAITAGNELKAGANGTAVAVTGDGTDSAIKFATALEGGASGERVLAILG